MSSKETISITVNRQQRLNIANRITDYLKKTEAIPVDTPFYLLDLLCAVSGIDTCWAYHLNDTTLAINVRPANDKINIRFSIAGKYAKTISGDLQGILDQYQ